MRSQGGTRSAVAVVVLVLATCTSQSRRQALAVADNYLCGCVNKIRIRTWSFVLKQRGLGHEGGEGVRENTWIPYLAALIEIVPGPVETRYDSALHDLHLFTVVHLLACVLYCLHFEPIEYRKQIEYRFTFGSTNRYNINALNSTVCYSA